MGLVFVVFPLSASNLRGTHHSRYWLCRCSFTWNLSNCSKCTNLHFKTANRWAKWCDVYRDALQCITRRGCIQINTSTSLTVQRPASFESCTAVFRVQDANIPARELLETTFQFLCWLWKARRFSLPVHFEDKQFLFWCLADECSRSISSIIQCS